MSTGWKESGKIRFKARLCSSLSHCNQIVFLKVTLRRKVGESTKTISRGDWIDEMDKEGQRYSYDVRGDNFLLQCGG